MDHFLDTENGLRDRQTEGTGQLGENVLNFLPRYRLTDPTVQTQEDNQDLGILRVDVESVVDVLDAVFAENMFHVEHFIVVRKEFKETEGG
jgi:hypothetical protein